MRGRSTILLLSVALQATAALLSFGTASVPARADERADALVRQVLQQVQQERPALADYRIDCAWNKQPGVVWKIAGRSTRPATGWFERYETPEAQEDIVFPTGLFLVLRRHIDPLPDEKKVRPEKPRLLPSVDIEGVPCSVVEFANALPQGGLNPELQLIGAAPLAEWDAAALRWYVDPQNRIRRISTDFQWKSWAGETDVRLTMNALVTHRKPKTAAADRPLSPPPIKQIVAGSDRFQSCTFAYSPDGRRFAAGGEFGAALYDTETWNPLAKFGGDPVSGLSFSPDNTTVVTMGWTGGRLRFWDAAAGTEMQSIETGAESVRSCLFLPGGRLLIGGTGSGAMVWDRATGRQLGPKLAGSDQTVALSADKRLAATEQGASIFLHDLERTQQDRLIGEKAANRSGIFSAPSLAFSPNGKWIAIGDNWNPRMQSGEIQGPSERRPLVRVFEVDTGRPVASLSGSVGSIVSLAFSPDGRMLAVGDEDNLGETIGTGGGVVLWDTATWKKLGVVAVDGQFQVGHIAFSPDGKTMATTGYSSELKIWKVPLLSPKP